jgi:Flp pilus assembly protein TadG
VDPMQSIRTLTEPVPENRAARASSKLRKNRTKGHAVIEAALLMPWLIFLFVGVFDMGFYCYDLINVENAVRIAAQYTATSIYTAGDSTKACTIVRNEMANVANLSGVSSCGSLPLIVTASSIPIGLDGAPATQVSVQYQSALFIPIPGLLTGRITITRIAKMRLRS